MFLIGGFSYLSTITNVDENLPISIRIKGLVYRECDLMLLDLAKALEDASMSKEVWTGKTLWL